MTAPDYHGPCLHYGHGARACPNPAGVRAATSHDNQCVRCGQPGHRSHACRVPMADHRAGIEAPPARIVVQRAGNTP